MNRFEKFLPSFIKQFNHYLLLNKPNLWATRVCMVVFLGLLFSTLLVGISFLVPMNYWQESKIAIIISFTVIFSIISFIVWLVYLFRFNPVKRFADDNTVRKPGSALIEFISYSFCICMFVLWSFIPPAIESYRTLNQLTANELASDINELNLKVATLEFDTAIMQFRADTVEFNQIAQPTDTYVPDNAEVGYVPSRYAHYPIDMMDEMLHSRDSSRKLNDTMYVLCDAPQVNFVGNNNLDKVSVEKQYTPFQIWKLAKDAQSVGLNRDQYFADIMRICKKYDRNWYEIDTFQNVRRNKLKAHAFQEIETKYALSQVNYVVYGISERMTRWTPDMLFIYGHIILYVVVLFAIAIFAFRHCHTKPYFVSYLTAFLLVAITSVFMAISNVASTSSILIVLLIYFVAFLSIAFSVFYTKKRNNIQIIATNITLFVFPFIPYLITILYLTIKQEGTIGEEYERISQQMSSCMAICEVLGVLLLLAVIEFVYKKIYAQWLSMPEE